MQGFLYFFFNFDIPQGEYLSSFLEFLTFFQTDISGSIISKLLHNNPSSGKGKNHQFWIDLGMLIEER